jgi:thaumarchaeosortase
MAREKSLYIARIIKENSSILIAISPSLSFVIPFLILYVLYPYSFEQTYHGRTLLLFFLWLVVLEIILDWKCLLKNRLTGFISAKTFLFIIVLSLPTAYVIIANYCGLNTVIENLALQNISQQDPLRENHASLVPISTEYISFAIFFCLLIFTTYGIKGLKRFSISALFITTIGVLFTIDLFYPYGQFTPLQILVPITATAAAYVLNFFGYQTSLVNIPYQYYGYMPYLTARDPRNSSRAASFGIAWPCAGVESLVIYTVTILFFLRRSGIPRKHKVIYFTCGAIVTYFINILRVVTIFLLAMEYGWPSPQAQRFHDHYGMLYSITWILLYPLIIIGTRRLWRYFKNRK